MSGHEEDRQFKAFVEEVRGAADREEAFWTRQAATIRERSTGRSAARGWALAVAAAGALAVAALQLGNGNVAQVPQPRGVASPAIIESAESDDELLAGVEQAVAREVPTALEPAVWLLDQ